MVFTDRYYTGPNLVLPFAKQHQTFWVGTVTAATKAYLPKKIMKGSKQAASLPRGETLWMHSLDGTPLLVAYF